MTEQNVKLTFCAMKEGGGGKGDNRARVYVCMRSCVYACVKLSRETRSEKEWKRDKRKTKKTVISIWIVFRKSIDLSKFKFISLDIR